MKLSIKKLHEISKDEDIPKTAEERLDLVEQLQFIVTIQVAFKSFIASGAKQSHYSNGEDCLLRLCVKKLWMKKIDVNQLLKLTV